MNILSKSEDVIVDIEWYKMKGPCRISMQITDFDSDGYQLTFNSDKNDKLPSLWERGEIRWITFWKKLNWFLKDLLS